MKSRSVKKTSKKRIHVRRLPRVLSFGKLKLTMTLKLSNDFFDSHKIDFHSIKTAKDISFIIEDKNLWNNITITSRNRTMNFILFMNKAEMKKCYIEHVLLTSIDLVDDAKPFKEIINYCLNRNNIMLIENCVDNIEEDFKCEIILIVKNEDNEKKPFVLSSKSSKTSSISTFSGINDTNVFSQIQNVDYQDFDYVYLDLDDFPLKSIVPFTEMLKTSSTIKTIINYTLSPSSSYNEETLTLILKLFSCSDIMIFESRTIYALLNVLYMIKRDNINQSELDKNMMYNFFISDIVRKSAFSFKSKILIFLDAFSSVTLIDVPYDKGEMVFTYDCVLHPKINHNNIQSIKEYKCEIGNNINLYSGIFTGCIIGHLVKNSPSSNFFYGAYLVGLESTKRILEINKNNYDLPSNPQFYIVKIPSTRLASITQEQSFKQREKTFVLDCINKKSSRIERYNALLDRHLNMFFSSDVIRKDLQNKGFINEEGYIVLDPYNRKKLLPSLSSSLSSSSLLLLKHSMSSSNMMNKKENAFLSTIQNLKIWKEPNKKEIDVGKSLEKVPEVTSVKIPLLNTNEYTMEKKKKIKLKPLKAKSCYV